jgi:hypothetical protein
VSSQKSLTVPLETKIGTLLRDALIFGLLGLLCKRGRRKKTEINALDSPSPAGMHQGIDK